MKRPQQGHPLEETTDYRGPKGPVTPPPRRVKLALPGSGVSTPHLTAEIQSLLRSRLRVAAAIIAAGGALFLLRNLLQDDGPAYPSRVSEMVLHAVSLVTSLVTAGLLFSRAPLGLRSLRVLELLLFGTVAAFFGWLQFGTFCNGGASSWAAPGKEGLVVRLSASPSELRWFLLVVLYGTFIPNTWRRCAATVGFLALLPIALTLYVGFTCPLTGHYLLEDVLPDTLLVMGLGAAIAVFGSYKFSALHQEAFQARQLGQYRLVRRLGLGGMGEVYLAEHQFLQRPCAIKLIRADRSGDGANLRRFEREVRATASLTHWNTVEIYDYGHTDDGTFYYVMEYLPGQNLQEMVYDHGPLPAARAIHLLRQVCGALREAHAAGLIHRDIKPSNILACERGGVYDVVKLVDFGLVQDSALAEKDGRLTRHGAIAGSPPYISPEQAKSKDLVDARSDIYSLGAVAYYLLTGRPSFERETAMEMVVAHLRDPVPPLTDFRPDVPPDLQAVVLRCLEKDPARRFQSVNDLDNALASCVDVNGWGPEQAFSWWAERAERRLVSPGAEEVLTQAV